MSRCKLFVSLSRIDAYMLMEAIRCVLRVRGCGLQLDLITFVCVLLYYLVCTVYAKSSLGVVGRPVASSSRERSYVCVCCVFLGSPTALLLESTPSFPRGLGVDIQMIYP